MQVVVLPRDERAHDASHEWWHYMMHLTADGPGVRGLVADGPDATAPRELMLVVSILKGAVYGLNAAAGVVGLAIVSDPLTTDYDVYKQFVPAATAYSAVDWGFRLDSESPLASGFGWTIRGGLGRHQLNLRIHDATVDLTLEQKTPAALIGENGIMHYTPGDAAAYVCWTQLLAEGSVCSAHGRSTVTGRGWLERQWGTINLAAHRWKYLAIVPDAVDERWLFFRMETRGHPARLYGARIDGDGRTFQLDPADVSIVDEGPAWRGYPLRTRVAVPSIGLDAIVTPWFEDQRCDAKLPQALVPVFYEGGSRISGTLRGRPLTGWAITEMKGYE